MISHQEIYNKVKAHLLKQGVRSQFVREDGTTEACAYRGPNGNMCAVGCLIDDEHFNNLYNRSWVGSDDVGTMLINSGVAPATAWEDDYDPTLALLTDLQRLHDQDPVETWESSLAAVAYRHNLEP